MELARQDAKTRRKKHEKTRAHASKRRLAHIPLQPNFADSEPKTVIFDGFELVSASK